MAKTCPSCVYHSNADNTCRHYAPSAVVTPDSGLTVVWPVVKATDWCAEGYNPTDGAYDVVTENQFSVMPQKLPGRKK